MRIGSSTDKKDSGRIHVDFAQARDDLYEWECKQRLLAREQRHRRQVHEDFLRPPSPPPVVHFSEHEAAMLAERLKDDQMFNEATAVLFAWIDRGEVNRRTANHFYSMIQSANSHVRRLMSEKAQHEEAMERAREAFKNALLAILTQCKEPSLFQSQHFQADGRVIVAIVTVTVRLLRAAVSYSFERPTTFSYQQTENLNSSFLSKQQKTIFSCHQIKKTVEQINAVFTAATRQKAWDHFSKAQRKNIDIWRKQCEELRVAHSEEIMGIRREEEMEMSDDDLDENPCKKLRTQENGVCDQTQSLREENDSLRWQLDSYRNEVDLLRKEQSRAGCPDDDLTPTHTHPAEAQQLVSLQEKLTSKEAELEQAREEQRLLQGEVLSLRDQLLNGPVEAPEADGESHEKRLFTDQIELLSVLCFSRPSFFIAGIISTFLHVHPFGANLEYLVSYIQRLDSKVSAAELERLMVRLPAVFRQELSGVGATLEKRWKFCGFDSLGSA
ncbi:hypothetical protein F2P81_021746 [Scophthalmus maximus]|uniref:Ecto-NOX disulfide-thiol exchanger 1/2 domain-containing protein n=1 Tax=Scophthalmus maximus TaxID=52904 RepID=A0A6A4S3C4_SCOMX|nr:hypothetical protein F2P81_021746 [Scophthalmus maximus]